MSKGVDAGGRNEETYRRSTPQAYGYNRFRAEGNNSTFRYINSARRSILHIKLRRTGKSVDPPSHKATADGQAGRNWLGVNSYFNPNAQGTLGR